MSEVLVAILVCMPVQLENSALVHRPAVSCALCMKRVHTNMKPPATEMYIMTPTDCQLLELQV